MGKSENEKKDGISVHEIENFGKNHRLEIFFCAIFIVSSFCSFLFLGPTWSIYALGLGGVLGSCFCRHISRLIIRVLNFCMSQQRATKIVIASVGVILSIFIAPLIFLCVGLVAGKSLQRCAKDSAKGHGCCKEDNDLHQ